jgi:membrane-associated phospholipid phosphatase
MTAHANARPARRGLRANLPPARWLIGWALLILAVLVASGWLLAKVATGNDLGRLDASLARQLASRRTPTLDDVTFLFTFLGGTLPVVVVGLVAALAARLAFRRWREPLLLVTALAGEVLLFLATTLAVDRPRPDVTHLDQAPPTSSFPSGHTAAAIVLYGAIAVIVRRKARSRVVRVGVVLLAVLIPILVGLSRMYRGMHFLTDVLGGAALGCAWLAVVVIGQGKDEG